MRSDAPLIAECDKFFLESGIFVLVLHEPDEMLFYIIGYLFCLHGLSSCQVGNLT
jgi:hypothetical protein